jgi:hypothetical protein
MAEYILEIVKVMVPVLTGFLVVVAKGIATQWDRKVELGKSDFIWVGAIAFAGFTSFGCWAGALSGGLIYKSGGDGTILGIGVTTDEAIALSRLFVQFAYNSFVLAVALSGIYYISLIRTNK